jgi:hypothetical protein
VTAASSRLRRLAQRSAEPARAEHAGRPQEEEQCELCGVRIEPEHKHVVDLSTRALMCACRACSILFDSKAAGGGHYRLVPDRRLLVEDFELDDGQWDSLRIPVEMAFFFHSSQAERVVAFYPGPMGATESLLELDAWVQLQAANPILAELEPDVEALLVRRARGARDHWIVPIDDCYDLVGLIRLRWKGLSGGQEVWQGIEAFFERLRAQGRPAARDGTVKRASARAAVAAGGREED